MLRVCEVFCENNKICLVSESNIAVESWPTCNGTKIDDLHKYRHYGGLMKLILFREHEIKESGSSTIADDRGKYDKTTKFIFKMYF